MICIYLHRKNDNKYLNRSNLLSIPNQRRVYPTKGGVKNTIGTYTYYSQHVFTVQGHYLE